jgi:hypothetical protein
MMGPDILQYGGLGLALAIAWKGADLITKIVETKLAGKSNGVMRVDGGGMVYEIGRTLSELSQDLTLMLIKQDELLAEMRENNGNSRELIGILKGQR